MPANTPEVVRMVWQTLELSDAVGGISLGGSRAKDYATRLSDWDLYLNGEPARLMAELPGLVAPLRPLAAFWEPLSEDAGYMMVMDGPVKVDLFPVGGRRSLQPPWELSGTTLGAIDGHFWDWVLWLGSKTLRGEAELVSDELAKMRGSCSARWASIGLRRTSVRRSAFTSTREARHPDASRYGCLRTWDDKSLPLSASISS